MCFEVLLGMSWGTLEEPFGNLIGTPPFPQPITSKLKRKIKVKINLVGMHVKASRWPHEILSPFST
jgi:hypothetical protein